MASLWDLKCSKCSFTRKRIESKGDAKRHAASHTRYIGSDHVVTMEELKPLPRAFLVGDRIKLKPDSAAEVARDSEIAGWPIDKDAIRTVTRIDEWCPGGGKRLFFDGPPHAFNSRDVQLAWNSDDERREALGL